MGTEPRGAAGRVLFIEDDVSVREGVAAALESFGYQVCALADGSGLGAVLDSFGPDLALLDVTLPAGPDGFELARQIRARGDIPIFFLTAADSLDDRVRGFDVGADDYLVKPFSIRELNVRLRAVLRRSAVPGRTSVEVGDVAIDLTTRTASRAGHSVALTPTEFDLLATLTRSPGRVWSKRDLLREVWGMDVHAPHLVEVHISAVRRKLEAHGPRMILTCRDGGYTVSG